MKTKTLQKTFFLICFLFSSIFSFSQNCPERSGTVKSDAGLGLPGVSVKVKGTTQGVVTAGDGSFKIKVCPGQSLVFSFIGFATNELQVTDKSIDENFGGLEVHLSGEDSGFSPYSYWSGAKLSYNVNTKSGGSDNFVGGASILINSVQLKNPNLKLDVVGNIGNFSASGTDADNGKKITKIAQSETGLSIGLAFTRQIIWGDDKEFALRPYFLSGYKLNSFTQQTKDSLGKAKTDTGTVALNQLHNTLGVEFEGFKFSQKGVMHLGLALNYDLFDQDKYYAAFNKKRSSLLSFGASVVFPISENIGFLLSGVYSKQFSPVYSIGLIIKSAKQESK